MTVWVEDACDVTCSCTSVTCFHCVISAPTLNSRLSAVVPLPGWPSYAEVKLSPSEAATETYRSSWNPASVTGAWSNWVIKTTDAELTDGSGHRECENMESEAAYCVLRMVQEGSWSQEHNGAVANFSDFRLREPSFESYATLSNLGNSVLLCSVGW